MANQELLTRSSEPLFRRSVTSFALKRFEIQLVEKQGQFQRHEAQKLGATFAFLLLKFDQATRDLAEERSVLAYYDLNSRCIDLATAVRDTRNGEYIGVKDVINDRIEGVEKLIEMDSRQEDIDLYYSYVFLNDAIEPRGLPFVEPLEPWRDVSIMFAYKNYRKNIF